MKLSRRFGVLGLAVGIMMSLSVAASFAGVSGPNSTSVSCDGKTVKSGVQVNTTATGNFSIKQNSSNPVSVTAAYATAHTGNSLGIKNVGDGQTVTWSSVLPATYTIKARRVGSENCNGAWPGHGNYTWNYTVTYVG